MADTADALFRVKVGERLFVLDRITLGDWRMFKTEFGLNASDIFASIPDGKGGTVEILNIDNPSVLVALITAALHHEDPSGLLSQQIAEVEDFELSGLEFPDLKAADSKSESDPQKDGEGDSGETAAPSKPGSSAKPRKSSGRQK